MTVSFLTFGVIDPNFAMFLTAIAWIGFSFGALLCVTNFYLSNIRYPLHRWRGRPRETYHWISGIPLFGQVFVGLSLLQLRENPWVLWAGIVLMLFDTLGFHVFISSLIYVALFYRTGGKSESNK